MVEPHQVQTASALNDLEKNRQVNEKFSTKSEIIYYRPSKNEEIKFQSLREDTL